MSRRAREQRRLVPETRVRPTSGTGPAGEAGSAAGSNGGPSLWTATPKASGPGPGAPGAGAPPPRPRQAGREAIQAGLLSRPGVAQLPLRIFLGITFVYAGLDKLLDRRFFDATAAGSIQSQLAAFAHGSPIGALVHLAEPLAVPIGFLIALAEIAIGLGALTGLAFRLAAAAGAAISLLFWLTASWGDTPYYFGPDLPYLFGWLTLALVGHGELYVVRVGALLAILPSSGQRDAGLPGPRGGVRGGGRGWDGRGPVRQAPGPATDASRRAILQVGLLAGATFVVSALAVPLRVLGISLSGGEAGIPTAGPKPAGTATPRPTGAAAAPTAAVRPTPVGGGGSGGLKIGSIADFASSRSLAFQVPDNAPSTLTAGDPGVIVKLADGSFVAFDAVCTHEGCTVRWSDQAGVLVCPCHRAEFDPTQQGAAIRGPARRALASLPISVDPSTGAITLQG